MRFPWIRSPIRVYISNSLPDQHDASVIIERLNRKKLGVQFKAYSDRDLNPGDIIEEKRKQWLEEADIILLLLSSAYVESKETRQEAESAFHRRRAGTAIVIPVYLTSRVEPWAKARFERLVPLLPSGLTFREAGPPELAADMVATALAESVERRSLRAKNPVSGASSTIREQIREPAIVTEENRFRLGWLFVNLVVILAVSVFLGFYAMNSPARTAPAVSGGRPPETSTRALDATSRFLFE